jgi:transcription elongation factor GreB
VSKAFTQEDTAEPPLVIAPRAPLPPGTPNYVTERGLALLREELAALQLERGVAERTLEGSVRAQTIAALAGRRAELESRIASAEVVALPTESLDTVRFGATVTLEGASGSSQRYRIVGVDEADPSHGKIAFVSPLARALLGRSAGESVRLRAPRGDEELEIVAVQYESESDPGSD